jgi:ketosteroid isomerase-like protein
MGGESNVAVVRTAFEDEGVSMAEDVVWHFLAAVPELLATFEGRDAVTVQLPEMLHQLTGGTFRSELIDVWAVGDDLAEAHIKVAMDIDGEHHGGSTVVVYRIADGIIVEGFDIPSAAI